MPDMYSKILISAREKLCTKKEMTENNTAISYV